jgi:hypothetical protein
LKEGEIQRAICDYLALKKHFFGRQNTAPVFDPVNKRFRSLPKYSMRGVPDIIVISKGGDFIGIEVKGEKGMLSEHQEAFRKLCNEHGVTYIVAKSVDDVIAQGL